MTDYAYEDLEAEAARELAENMAYESECSQEELEAQKVRGHMEAGFLIGYLKSAANSKIRTNEVRYFALEVLAALNKDCK